MVASIVLAGGMATHFGGVVKGVVEAIDGRSSSRSSWPIRPGWRMTRR